VPKRQKTYDAQFRQEAVDLLLNSGRPLKRVAAELGLSPKTLRDWRDRALGNGRAGEAAARREPGQAAAGAPVADAAAEIRRLQKEVEYLRRQREILKKALSILGEDPQHGMR
jgi:transposase-like protein